MKALVSEKPLVKYHWLMNSSLVNRQHTKLAEYTSILPWLAQYDSGKEDLSRKGEDVRILGILL